MPANRARGLQIYDPVLTQIARRYKPDGFIGRSLLSDVPVSKLSGQYPVFTKRFWFQNDVDNEAVDRAPTKEVDFEWSTDTYLAREYRLKVSWTDLELDQADSSLHFKQNKAEFLRTRMDTADEVRVAAKLRKTTNGGGLNLGATPGTNWDQATAEIEADIKLGVIAVYDATGQLPDTIVIPYKVAYAMSLQEDIRAILRSDATGKGVDYLKMGDRILPAVIHGMRVVIPYGPQLDSAGEGSGSDSITDIWGDHVRLLKLGKGQTWGIPSVAYRLSHTKLKATRWHTVDPDVEYLREMERYEIKVVAPDLGYEITAVLS